MPGTSYIVARRVDFHPDGHEAWGRRIIVVAILLHTLFINIDIWTNIYGNECMSFYDLVRLYYILYVNSSN
jgi:hypothetical protein